MFHVFGEDLLDSDAADGSEDSDLEELEIALYGQIYYDTPTEQLGQAVTLNRTDANGNIINTHDVHNKITSPISASNEKIKDLEDIKSIKSEHLTSNQLLNIIDLTQNEEQVVDLTGDHQRNLNSSINRTQLVSDDNNAYITVGSSPGAELSASESRYTVAKHDGRSSCVNLCSSTSSASLTFDSCDSDVSETAILGQDFPEDSNLQLNVRNIRPSSDQRLGKLESHDDDQWSVDDDDLYQAGISYLKWPRYYGNVNVRCHNCNEKGHLSKCCPRPKKRLICTKCGFTGHNTGACPYIVCYNCYSIGHSYRECSEKRHNYRNQCHRCGMKGHASKHCPDVWRQYHLTTNSGNIVQSMEDANPRVFCYNCASNEHFGFECEEVPFDHYSYPTWPFIAKYDKNTDQAKRKRESSQDGNCKKRRKLQSEDAKKPPDMITGRNNFKNLFPQTLKKKNFNHVNNGNDIKDSRDVSMKKGCSQSVNNKQSFIKKAKRQRKKMENKYSYTHKGQNGRTHQDPVDMDVLRTDRIARRKQRKMEKKLKRFLDGFEKPGKKKKKRKGKSKSVPKFRDSTTAARKETN